jgi:hypothetical protein
LKRQTGQKLTFHCIVAQWRRTNLIPRGPRASECQLLSDELIKNESLPWWTLAVVVCSLTRRIGWQRGVKGFDGLSEPRHREVTDQIGRYRLPEIGFPKGISNRRPKCRLTNPGNGWVNRHQTVRQWRPVLIATNGRMNQFKTKETTTNQPVRENRSPRK